MYANMSNTHKSERYQQALQMSFVDKIKQGIAHKSLAPMLPDHIAFADGTIFNSKQGSGGNRFVSGALSDNGYLQLNTSNKSYRIHRLICWAFHAIEGKSLLDDYQDYDCIHINGNKVDNNAENLEWIKATKSEKSTKTKETPSKKSRKVIQYTLLQDGSMGAEVARFDSIAKAARETQEPEHRIRETANGKQKKLVNFVWKFEDDSQTLEWSNKFSGKRKQIE